MTLEFVKELNEYVIDATLESSDEEILAALGTEGYPTWEDVHHARSMVEKAIREQRQNRLNEKITAFEAYKQEQKQQKVASSKRSITDMLADIVSTMQNKDQVPEGLLIAFREQGQNGSEDDIKTIWENLVELGLIDPNDSDKSS